MGGAKFRIGLLNIRTDVVEAGETAWGGNGLPGGLMWYDFIHEVTAVSQSTAKNILC